MKSNKIIILTLLVLGFIMGVFSPNSLFSQQLTYESRIGLVVGKGMNVTLYKGQGTNKWYYLPPSQSIRLGKKTDGTPEFLFLKFTTEERVEQGGAQGAILHCLLEWGLTDEVIKELDTKLKEKTRGIGELAGPIDLRASQGESFRIISAILQDKQMTSTLITSGLAPPMGGKAAVAARLDKNGAQLLDATLNKSRSISDISLVLDYEYTVLVKAAKGTLTYKLDITHNQGDGMAYELMKKELDKQPELYNKALKDYEKNKKKMTDECGVGDGLANVMIGLQAIDNVLGNTSGSGDTGSPWEYGVSENMMRKMYDHFESKELINLSWQENIDDERLKVIREAFFNFFLNAFTEPAFPELTTMSGLQNNITLGDQAIKNSAQGGYKFKSCTQLNASRTLRKTIKLENIILPLKVRYQMVSNIASTYDQVKNNLNCVKSVNLNDPFFKHRDINFIVDIEAMNIFKDEVNHVAVQVRKKRSAGNDFSEGVLINPEVMREKGRLATLTYARGEDKNPDVYEYRTQWSLSGGQLYPPNPAWEKGDWQGITLTAPVKPRTIEFEANLDECKEAGIVRATLQLRYMKYDQEVESNIPLTITRGEPLVSKTIYTDRKQVGYAYRLIITHKEKGKYVTDWDAKVNDDYIYATVPKKFEDTDEIFKGKFKKILEVVTETVDAAKVISPESRILTKFKDVLKILIN